jgi:hypothetical protein
VDRGTGVRIVKRFSSAPESKIRDSMKFVAKSKTASGVTPFISLISLLKSKIQPNIFEISPRIPLPLFDGGG